MANGRLHDGLVAQIIRKRRASYHVDVRRVMREQEQTKMESLTQSVQNSVIGLENSCRSIDSQCFDNNWILFIVDVIQHAVK